MPRSKSFVAAPVDQKRTGLRTKSPAFRCIFAPQPQIMNKVKFFGLLLLFVLLITAGDVMAQCSICTKTAQQLGEGPAKGMNSGILYLAFAPMAIIGFLTYRWIKSNRSEA